MFQGKVCWMKGAEHGAETYTTTQGEFDPSETIDQAAVRHVATRQALVTALTDDGYTIVSCD